MGVHTEFLYSLTMHTSGTSISSVVALRRFSKSSKQPLKLELLAVVAVAAAPPKVCPRRFSNCPSFDCLFPEKIGRTAKRYFSLSVSGLLSKSAIFRAFFLIFVYLVILFLFFLCYIMSLMTPSTVGGINYWDWN